MFLGKIHYNRFDYRDHVDANHEKKEINVSSQKNMIEPKTWRNPEILLEILPILFHKLKNKLTPILGYAQILKAVITDPGHASRLGKIETAALDLTELMNLLRENFTLPKSQPEPRDLKALTAAVAAEWIPLLQSNHIQLLMDSGNSPISVKLYPQEIRALICELIDNSVNAIRKAQPPEGQIRLSLQDQNSIAVLSLRDNGAGMSEPERDQAWNPFYSTIPDHAGLGLVICETIVKNHLGKARIESEPGQFCEFIFEFPKSDSK